MSAHDEGILRQGSTYERFMGRWSPAVGRPFLDWLRVPRQQRWLEVGCGTGAFTEVILSRCDPQSIVAFDASEQQIAYARSRLLDARVDIRVGDAMSIAAQDDQFDIAAAALVLNFIPDQRKALAEMVRVVRTGGTVAVYVWDFAGRRNITQHLSEAVAFVSSDAERSARAAQQADTTSPEALAKLFDSIGLGGVETRRFDITAQFSDFDDYWISNTALISPVSVIGTASRALTPGQIHDLRRRLQQTLPIDRNGKIAFNASAWAARGTVQ